jgi:hypothetical protein
MTRVLATVALGLFGLWPAAADESAWAALRENGRVALLRHAATAGGAGDPPGFNLEDCATQRNLTEAGRAQARTLGARFRAEGIWVAKVLTSEWCRCRETGALMEIGLVEPAPTFNNAYRLRHQASVLTGGARSIIAAWKGPRRSGGGDARGEHPSPYRLGSGRRRHRDRRTRTREWEGLKVIGRIVPAG